ncbi:cytochrome P450 [Crucibulum laeve]|uniref:Cytochrome P450 n=1 Tax=Crucibulum laeve TaxID=68775 RepID=A0A5C3M9C6_9AGAR|nr:cytochrome P450 [Crucibulum laeve]
MASLTNPVLAVVVATLAIAIVQRLLKKTIRAAPLPPGPKGLPIIGNLRDMPEPGQEWFTFTDLAKQYGEIVHLEVFGQSIVILNSTKATTELFDRRSSNYSDRPGTVMVNDILGWGDWIIGFMPYGEFWRRHRKIFHNFFHPKAVTAYQPVQRNAIKTMLKELHDTPSGFANHVLRYTGTVILDIMYGYKVKAENDSYVSLAKEANEGFIRVAGHTFLVDLIPGLRRLPSWLPGMGSLRSAEIYKKNAFNLRDTPFELLKASIANGTVTPCLASDILAAADPNTDDADVLRNCAGAAYGAAADTTMSTLVTLILAMALNPEVQKKAQAEVDAALAGDSERLPDLNDMPSMPYLQSCISEALRWRPPIPMAIPHKNINEDVYEGYSIPAGSVVLGNVWGILHDENVYPEPETFRPERFLTKDGNVVSQDPVSTAFGFGRRICPGKYLALNSAFLAFSSILASYDISNPTDVNGNKLTKPVDYTTALLPLLFLLSQPPDCLQRQIHHTLSREGRKGYADG